MATDLYCPRCESWTVSKAPAGDRSEAYCSRAGCEWEGKIADARSTLARLDAEKNRADHWMAVALAFRDATTDAAVEARDGERDPYLERAQDLYNAAARDFGPVAEYNRFFCDCCDATVRVDEDGCCATCGGDTWGVFEAGRE